MNNTYSVKLPSSGRYILWCDEHWYETTPEPYPFFEKEQAETIVKQLRNHYTYNAVVVDAQGNEINKPKVSPIKEFTEEKKSFFRKF